MILYWFLLLFTAVIAYGLGSMSTMLIASRYVFRANLNSLGKGNIWISNFRRIYGVWGWIRLLLVEIVKDALPVGLGALLLGFKGHADVGCAFAGFCVVLGVRHQERVVQISQRRMEEAFGLIHRRDSALGQQFADGRTVGKFLSQLRLGFLFF